MIPRMIQQLLRTLHRNRALTRQQLGNLQRRLNSLLFILCYLTDKSYSIRFFCAEDSRGETHLFYPGEIADYFRQAREGSYVGGETDVDFFYGELDVGCADADVGAGGDVEGEAKGEAVEDADDG